MRDLELAPEQKSQLAAAYALHRGPGIPDDTDEVKRAKAALTDLEDRVDGTEMKRDERRLASRYQKTIRDGEIDLVQYARDHGLPNPERH